MRFSFKTWILVPVLLLNASFLGHSNHSPTGPVAVQMTLTANAKLSPETQAALAYLAKRENIPPERLQVVNTHWQEYPALNQK